MFRKVIRIRAEDSPNVRLAMAQQRRGLVPTGETVVPGVLSWHDYQKKRATWDPTRQMIGLDAEFPENQQTLLFPFAWLDRAMRKAKELEGAKRDALAMGVDSAEGGDMTSWAVTDAKGLIELISMKTPDTSVIVGQTIALIAKHRLDPGKVMFDRGGGGKQHADLLRAKGYDVRTVAFGESLAPDPKRRGLIEQVGVRLEQREERYAYKNRRAEMYGMLSNLLDPGPAGSPNEGFGLPCDAPPYDELRRQLSLIPRQYDQEGRMVMLPKNKPTVKRDALDPADGGTLVGLIGHSPDEADALVLAVHGMTAKSRRPVAGAV
jgi:hypothetical protein